MEYAHYEQLIEQLNDNGGTLSVGGTVLLVLDPTVKKLSKSDFNRLGSNDTVMLGSINIYSLWGDESARPIRMMNARRLAQGIAGVQSPTADAEILSDGSRSEAVDSRSENRSGNGVGNAGLHGEEICVMLGRRPSESLYRDELGLMSFPGDLVFVVVDGNHRTWGLRDLLPIASSFMLRFRLIKTLSEGDRVRQAVTTNSKKGNNVKPGFFEFFHFVARRLILRADGTLIHDSMLQEVVKPHFISQALAELYPSNFKLKTAQKFVYAVITMAGYEVVNYVWYLSWLCF